MLLVHIPNLPSCVVHTSASRPTARASLPLLLSSAPIAMEEPSTPPPQSVISLLLPLSYVVFVYEVLLVMKLKIEFKNFIYALFF
ncbi:hypothetical protein Syun_019111 [Stephania yunnanensis]|uniref:Uncharacterized protein n=1 Tax=Stephania yunnanensis TaxID=152371 RepID=A0AAP0NX00_9MAGN